MKKVDSLAEFCLCFSLPKALNKNITLYFLQYYGNGTVFSSINESNLKEEVVTLIGVVKERILQAEMKCNSQKEAHNGVI